MDAFLVWNLFGILTGSSFTKPLFGVTLAEVAIICPDNGWGRDTLTKNTASERSPVYIHCTGILWMSQEASKRLVSGLYITLEYTIYKQVI